ncbi:hypothetical protein C8R47DRAFT_1074638 [Mycena vitilis]|nr:hypothetical protein C8R47DRAFT_1074638 [Mycena vitilis]
MSEGVERQRSQTMIQTQSDYNALLTDGKQDLPQQQLVTFRGFTEQQDRAQVAARAVTEQLLTDATSSQKALHLPTEPLELSDLQTRANVVVLAEIRDLAGRRWLKSSRVRALRDRAQRVGMALKYHVFRARLWPDDIWGAEEWSKTTVLEERKTAANGVMSRLPASHGVICHRLRIKTKRNGVKRGKWQPDTVPYHRASSLPPFYNEPPLGRSFLSAIPCMHPPSMISLRPPATCHTARWMWLPGNSNFSSSAQIRLILYTMSARRLFETAMVSRAHYSVVAEFLALLACNGIEEDAMSADGSETRDSGDSVSDACRDDLHILAPRLTSLVWTTSPPELALQIVRALTFADRGHLTLASERSSDLVAYDLKVLAETILHHFQLRHDEVRLMQAATGTVIGGSTITTLVAPHRPLEARRNGAWTPLDEVAEIRGKKADVVTSRNTVFNTTLAASFSTLANFFQCRAFKVLPPASLFALPNPFYRALVNFSFSVSTLFSTRHFWGKHLAPTQHWAPHLQRILGTPLRENTTEPDPAPRTYYRTLREDTTEPDPAARKYYRPLRGKHYRPLAPVFSRSARKNRHPPSIQWSWVRPPRWPLAFASFFVGSDWRIGLLM